MRSGRRVPAAGAPGRRGDRARLRGRRWRGEAPSGLRRRRAKRPGPGGRRRRPREGPPRRGRPDEKRDHGSTPCSWPGSPPGGPGPDERSAVGAPAATTMVAVSSGRYEATAGGGKLASQAEARAGRGRISRANSVPANGRTRMSSPWGTARERCEFANSMTEGSASTTGLDRTLLVTGRNIAVAAYRQRSRHPTRRGVSPGAVALRSPASAPGWRGRRCHGRRDQRRGRPGGRGIECRPAPLAPEPFPGSPRGTGPAPGPGPGHRAVAGGRCLPG